MGKETQPSTKQVIQTKLAIYASSNASFLGTLHDMQTKSHIADIVWVTTSV